MESQLKVSENVDGKMRSRKPIRSKSRESGREYQSIRKNLAYLAQFLVKYARNLLPNSVLTQHFLKEIKIEHKLILFLIREQFINFFECVLVV